MGKVYLVGAGPGDPELITQKGARLLRQADAVIYDRLIDPELLKLTPSRCRRIDVGKRSDEGGKTQTAINRILVREGKRSSKVIRLKGGDPALFGRISEEIEALLGAGIPFEVVPGVSSAWAAASLAGFPLTDRRFSSSVAIATGQGAGGRPANVRWDLLAKGADTIVILMGFAELPRIVGRLLKAGRPAATPIALIRWAATPKQELLVGTLGGIRETLEKRTDFGPPVVAVIGQVVKLREKFKTRPLEGKKVLVTRPTGDQAGLVKKLEQLGADCVGFPTIRISPSKLSAGEQRALLEKLPSFDWVIFTSHYGVEGLERIAGRAGQKLARLVRGKVCAIGPRTGKTARSTGLKVALVPDPFSKSGIEQAFAKFSVKGKRILIPRSNLGVRDALAENLRKRGAQVAEPILYETKLISRPARKIEDALKKVDAATFTSASTVHGFLKGLGGKNPRRMINGTPLVAIGPETAKALKGYGVASVHLPKKNWTVDGLVEAVQEALAP